MYLELGRVNGQWWPIEIISIGSLILGNQSGIHLTYNPTIMQSLSAAFQEGIH